MFRTLFRQFSAAATASGTKKTVKPRRVFEEPVLVVNEAAQENNELSQNVQAPIYARKLNPKQLVRLAEKSTILAETKDVMKHAQADSLVYVCGMARMTDMLGSKIDKDDASYLMTVVRSFLGRPRGEMGHDEGGYSRMLNSIAKYGVLMQNETNMKLAREACSLASSFNARQTAMSILALAKLGIAEDKCIKPLIFAIDRCAASFDATGSSMCLFALAKLNRFDAELVKKLYETFITQEPNGLELANCIWSLAILNKDLLIELTNNNIVQEVLNNNTFITDSMLQLLQADAAVPFLKDSTRDFFNSAVVSNFNNLFSAPTTVLAQTNSISKTLTSMGYNPQNAFEDRSLVPPCLTGLYPVDFICKFGSVGKTAVFFDNKLRFNRVSDTKFAYNGSALLRNKTFLKNDINLLLIPHFDWDPNWEYKEREEYLAKKISTIKTAL